MSKREPSAKTWLVAVGASLALHLIALAGFGSWAKGRAPVLMPGITAALRPLHVALAQPAPPAPEASPRIPVPVLTSASTPLPRPTATARAAGERRAAAGPRRAAPAPAPPPPAKIALPPEAIRPTYRPPDFADGVELVRPVLPAEYVIEDPNAAPSPSVFDLGAGPGDARGGVRAGVPGGAPGGVPGGVAGGIPAGVVDGVAGGAPDGVVGGVPGGTPDGSTAGTDGNAGGGEQARPPAPPPKITPAEAIATPACAYPKGALRQGRCGSVRLKIRIRRDGRVGDVEVVKSAGDRRLDDAAVKVVTEEWLFSPAREGDAPIEQTSVATVRFIID